MSLNLKITEETELNQALLNVIRSDDNIEALKMVKRMEDLAGLIYHALPDKNKPAVYIQRMNCNISWYSGDRKLAVSFLLFMDSMIFEPTPEGVRLTTLDGGWPISWLIKLLEDAIKHYLTEDGSSFKKVIAKYGLAESIKEGKNKKSA